jgi:hypothetical protein
MEPPLSQHSVRGQSESVGKHSERQSSSGAREFGKSGNYSHSHQKDLFNVGGGPSFSLTNGKATFSGHSSDAYAIQRPAHQMNQGLIGQQVGHAAVNHSNGGRVLQTAVSNNNHSLDNSMWELIFFSVNKCVQSSKEFPFESRYYFPTSCAGYTAELSCQQGLFQKRQLLLHFTEDKALLTSWSSCIASTRCRK